MWLGYETRRPFRSVEGSRSLLGPEKMLPSDAQGDYDGAGDANYGAGERDGSSHGGDSMREFSHLSTMKVGAVMSPLWMMANYTCVHTT